MNTILSALEQHLADMPDNLPTAWPNVNYKPVTGQIYQRVDHLINAPRDWVIERTTVELRGILQVTICAPLNTGRAIALTKAQAVADHFPAASMIGGILLPNTPRVTSPYRDDDRYCVPVSIEWSYMQ